MRGKPPPSRSSYIRELPFSVLRKLSHELDLDRLWEKLVENIPRYLNSTDLFQPRYTAQQVGLFGRQMMMPNGSPTRAIIQDWGTQNCTVQHLLDVLDAAELISAAQYIKTEVLKETDETEPEGEEPPAIAIPQDLLPPLEISATPGDHRHRVAECLSIEPSSDTETDTLEKAVLKPVQNDLSLSSVTDPDQYTLDHRRQYNSFGGAGALAESSPNFDSKECDKVQGKEFGEKIVGELLPPVECEPPSKCPGGPVGPVIQYTGEVQHVPYRDLEMLTDGFNDVLYSEGGRLIGKGGFGMVHLGVDRNQKKIAVKVLKDNTETLRKQFRTEVDTLSKLKHKHLLSLIAYSCDGPKSCIVYEYMPNGSLEDRLAFVNGTPPIPAEVRIRICKGSAQAIAYLNRCGFVHRDIKSANILLDEEFVPKLGDFATARLGPSGNSYTQAGTNVLIGTTAYLAPEAHNFDVSAKLDSFSFGVVTLELLTGLPAYDGRREDRDLRSHMMENCEDIMLMVDRYAGDWLESSVRSLYNIALQCLELRKKKRALIGEMLYEIENL